jgi:hypothetical protein
MREDLLPSGMILNLGDKGAFTGNPRAAQLHDFTDRG